MIGIVPAAGLGERMKSITHGRSKEALPLGDRTVLDYVLDELFACPVDRVIVVSRREKLDIEEIVARRTESIDLKFQSEPCGLMDAIGAAGVVEDSLIALPDTLFSKPILQDFTSDLKFRDGSICVQNVSDADVSNYGIVELEPGSMMARKFVEKPRPEEVKSRCAIAARYFLTDRVMRLIRAKCRSESFGEPLVEVFNDGLQHQMVFTTYCIPNEIKRFDCGSIEGYEQARAYFEIQGGFSS